MAPFVKVMRVSADMRDTNILLARIADALESQNVMLGYVASSPVPDKATNDRTDDVNEELLAAVERAEDAGITVPRETYKRLGIPAPGEREDGELLEWDEDLDEDSEMPGADEMGDEVKSSRRTI